MRERLQIGILLSGKGRGSNMQALIDGTRDGRIHGDVALVISTSPGAPALERAAASGVPALLIPAEEHPEPGALDRELAEQFQSAGVELICLAGYMRLLGPEFLGRFPNRVLNVHPALLPAFGGRGYYGRRVHEAVLESGARYSGVTVHLTDDEYDHGPIVAQEVVPVLRDDTVETLAARVLQAEHRLYPEAVALFAARRVHVEGRRVLIDPPQE